MQEDETNRRIKDLENKQRRERESLTYEHLIESACLAEELFDIDDLERFAHEQRRKENRTS